MKGLKFFSASGVVLLPGLAPFLIFGAHVESIIQRTTWPLYAYLVVLCAAAVFVPEFLLRKHPQSSWRIGLVAWVILFALTLYASNNLFGVNLDR